MTVIVITMVTGTVVVYDLTFLPGLIGGALICPIGPPSLGGRNEESGTF
jgi:hypothetical protein